MKKKGTKATKMGLKKISLITLTVGGVLLLFNFTFLSQNAQVFAVMNMSATLIIIGVPLSYRYSDFRETKQLEEIFPKYLRDVSQNISAGMTLPQAMKATLTNDYEVLNPYIIELSAKISWGISFEKAMEDFAKKTKSVTMRRNVQTIVETHRSGGQIASILVSVAQSLQDLEKIKKERSSGVYSQMINGYLIYVVFLGVMIGMSTVLIPAFRMGSTETSANVDFVELFRSLTVIQGFFAGMAIGKMAEGTIVAGIKHAMVLVIFGYSAFLIFV